ncbi:hypothetical protein [Microlunatus flavus]|uniref:Uncharacterized protein n=1 Tax=Microlunatus flavus TaxID=1036181 RepID=A0A1H9N1K9_9ACTN|nr:hypothetical protein [Microlunatus flavus]SER29778.1 hypothetical protein SAMN05421756_11246 [Microlunatus flavus]
MKRLVSVVASAALAVGLVCAGSPASASPGCDRPDEAVGITVSTQDSTILGPLQTATFFFEATARTACLADYPLTLDVRTASTRSIPLVPTTVLKDREQGFTFYRGTFTADAAALTNADAGEWLFEITLGDVGFGLRPYDVLRRTRLSFDAGPEPLRRNHRLTFRGALQVADWERDRYRGLAGQPVGIVAIDSQTTVPWVPLVETTTRRHGRYRVRHEVPGTDRYEAVYHGTRGIAFTVSRIDAVAERT